jgi:hypothetical protein
LILRQERCGVSLCERNKPLYILKIVDGARLDSVAAINSLKSHIFLLY